MDWFAKDRLALEQAAVGLESERPEQLTRALDALEKMPWHLFAAYHDRAPESPTLGLIRDRIIPRLIRTMAHEEPEFAGRAMRLMWWLAGYPDAFIANACVLPLIELARSEDTGLRRAGVYVLSFLGPRAGPAAEVLWACLASEDEETRDGAIRALARMGPVGKSYLLKGMKGEDAVLRHRALTALRIGGCELDRSETLDLLALLEHDDVLTREGAAGALVMVVCHERTSVDPDLVKLLVEALDSHHPPVRRSAAEALGCTGAAGKATLPRLLDLLQDPDPYVRRFAVRAVRQLGPTKDCLLPLRVALWDRVAIVREEAADTLAVMGALAADAIEQMERIAKHDPDAGARGAAKDALAVIKASPSTSGNDGSAPPDG